MIDYNSFIGQWPFRYTRKNTLEELQKYYDKYEIESGYIGNLNSIFYNDPFEGDKILFEKLKGTSHKPVLSLNINLPGNERDIKKANQLADYDSIRIYPSIHKYELEGNEFNEFLHMVSEYNKKLFISYRMGDRRLDYILNQELPTIDNIKNLFNNKYSSEIYLLNLKSAEVIELSELFKSSNNVFFDSSDVKHETFAMEKFKELGIYKNCVFGSFYPLYAFESSLYLYNRT